MKHPLDLMQAVHRICEEELIPKGLHEPHDFNQHAPTATLYYRALNRAGLGNADADKVAASIIEAAGWDKNSPWPGHPSPDKVVAILKHD